MNPALGTPLRTPLRTPISTPLSTWASPLYGRLLIWFIAANLATMLLGIFVTDRFVHRSGFSEPDWAELALSADQAYEAGGTAALEAWSDERREDGVEAMLFENGRPLLARPLPPPLEELLPRLLANDDIVLRPAPDLRVVGKSVTGTDGVARQLVAVRGPMPRYRRRSIYLTVQIVLSLIAIGGVGWWIARSVARPVEALRGAATRMAAGELSARVGPRWTRERDELGALARDFDAMAGRIESLVAHERSVLQDLSHELRSPLARLHLILNLAQSSGGGEDAAAHFQRAEGEIQRLDRTIGEMLALSRMEAELPGMERDRVGLAALAGERVSAHRLEAQARNIQLSIASSATATVLGSPPLLERALDNLLTNAIKFSEVGGAIEVTIGAEPAQAWLDVRDHGPGVPADELDSLFRPFFRGANGARASGHGLGLTLVERIARAHHGSVVAMNAAGGGLAVRLWLPLASAES